MLLLLLASLVSFTAQGAVKCRYKGKSLGKGHVVTVEYMGPLDTSCKKSFQGMDIWGKYMVSLQHTGMATLYTLDGNTAEKKGQFKLASYDSTAQGYNHANVASFGCRPVRKSDVLPLLYVTRCNPTRWKGLDQVLFVERIRPDRNTAELVQVIGYEDSTILSRHTTQWVVDCQTGSLYGFGNTSANPNRHFVVKFRLPEYRGPADCVVHLHEKDLLEKYFMEDYGIESSFQPVIQGACVRDGLLYMPTGVGTEKRPSILYVWDLNKRKMRNAIDLQKAIPVEMEDCCFVGNYLMVQCQKCWYRLSFE